jgi:alkanesulfonate monooxygenase SsuD/methylene tetrahydromethanopterin reductase-like flavin-dependent oxidoreductase (luciferase family)
MATTRIGMIATASTTYTEPFNLARQFASLDHISNGRVAWNIVTSWLATAARNFGGTGQVSHADRYARGEEFMTVVKALWDSWADAVVDDRVGGHYARADRIRPINHRGDFYFVARSTCRAARRGGRCWCRRDRPTPAAGLRRGMPMPCSPLMWRRRRRRISTPT